MKDIIIYTDGACSGNPGAGGWGAVIIYKDVEKFISGYEPQTTNNRMEIMSVIMALKALKEPCNVNIFSDSQYVCNGITKWLSGWKKNSWRGADKKPIKNRDLWEVLDTEIGKHKTLVTWVRGHNGDKYNEIADQLARDAIKNSIHNHPTPPA